MQSHRVLGTAIALSGAMLMWMAIAATSVGQDQLIDPLVGHLARNTMRYAAIATAMFIAELTLLLIHGSRRGARAAGAWTRSRGGRNSPC